MNPWRLRLSVRGVHSLGTVGPRVSVKMNSYNGAVFHNGPGISYLNQECIINWDELFACNLSWCYIEFLVSPQYFLISAWISKWELWKHHVTRNSQGPKQQNDKVIRNAMDILTDLFLIVHFSCSHCGWHISCFINIHPVVLYSTSLSVIQNIMAAAWYKTFFFCIGFSLYVALQI